MHSKEKPVRPLRLVAVTSLLLALPSAPARADGFIVPFIGFNFGGDSSNCPSLADCSEKRTNFGASLGSMGSAFGFEEDISYAKHFFGDTPGTPNSILSLMSNLLVGVGVGPVRPYVLGGVGLIRPHVSSLTSSLTSLSATDKNAVGYDIGGGVIGMFGSHVGIRGDLRHFHTVRDVNLLIFKGQKLDFWRASAGLVLGF